MEGFTVDSEDHIEQLALCTEGSQALQKTSAVASCREGTLEGSIPVGQAARTAEERHGSETSRWTNTPSHNDTDDTWNWNTEWQKQPG